MGDLNEKTRGQVGDNGTSRSPDLGADADLVKEMESNSTRIADCKSFTNGDAVDFMVYQNLLIFIGPLVFVLRWCTIGPKIKDVPQDDEDTG